MAIKFRNFNPRSPWGERPKSAIISLQYTHISIHAPRGGSDGVALKANTEANKISIHAPREGSDIQDNSVELRVEISIHAPREGSDCMEDDKK